MYICEIKFKLKLLTLQNSIWLESTHQVGLTWQEARLRISTNTRLHLECTTSMLLTQTRAQDLEDPSTSLATWMR